ncbi:ferritin-like domain-containing protein [Aequorivita sp. H23M31]|uniref:Ferritin-like domain-containing protein n=1 Tax=Aequorivita ciconiae TaxID=2494375 RepID=A0A410G5C4_9FLAO|nr:ferritin-like domain-containing protein [Aequorivita sp. H23M31]QAA82477.1 ferritin-like domain-containing protein [Aequorivita sp. H23M31]
MNIIKIMDYLSDSELMNTKSSRRDSFGHIKTLGKNVAMASIPFGLAATSTKTRATTLSMASSMMMADPLDILNFALTLEYLERNFYQMGLDTNGLIPAEDRPTFAQISKHETSHVEFLLSALGDDAVSEPTFDFTGGSLNLDTFSNYQTFLALSQGFEDTGVRAYKGQAGGLIDNADLLTYALQIHSVEALHASQVRRMRGEKGWITKSENTLPGAFSAIYGGATPESNTVQGGVDLSGLFNDLGGNNAVTESFDEPLTMDEVNAIASIFIVP